MAAALRPDLRPHDLGTAAYRIGVDSWPGRTTMRFNVLGEVDVERDGTARAAASRSLRMPERDVV
jgi:hypothetical protein